VRIWSFKLLLLADESIRRNLLDRAVATEKRLHLSKRMPPGFRAACKQGSHLRNGRRIVGFLRAQPVFLRRDLLNQIENSSALKMREGTEVAFLDP
jgi:hypothetical protein